MYLLDHPYLLMLAIVLSLLGSFYAWRGFRQRNVFEILLGIGLTIPTLDMSDWRMWLAGLAVCAVGNWLRMSAG